MVNGRLQVKWTSKLPFPTDKRLSSCGKHKGQCIRCVCVLNQLPCTVFCDCPNDCINRKSIQNTAYDSQASAVSLFRNISLFCIDYTLSIYIESLESNQRKESSDHHHQHTIYVRFVGSRMLQ